jgi:hypothetical protein
MYLKTIEPFSSPKLLVALPGGQEEHSIINYFATVTARAMANIPALSGCQVLNLVVFKLSR